MADKKNKGGRPPKYSAAEDMQLKVDEYFADREANDKPKTIAGLTLACGFASRTQYYEYEKKEEFKHVLKKARMRIEGEFEERLCSGNSTGSIFWLKNHAGYKDKTETDINHKGEIIHKVERIIVKPQ